MFVIFLSGCGLPRHAVPDNSVYEARIRGMQQVRYWDIQYNPDVTTQESEFSACSFLALSGSGTNGAFDAGFLCGWTEAAPAVRVPIADEGDCEYAKFSSTTLSHFGQKAEYTQRIHSISIKKVECRWRFYVKQNV